MNPRKRGSAHYLAADLFICMTGLLVMVTSSAVAQTVRTYASKLPRWMLANDKHDKSGSQSAHPIRTWLRCTAVMTINTSNRDLRGIWQRVPERSETFDKVFILDAKGRMLYSYNEKHQLEREDTRVGFHVSDNLITIGKMNEDTPGRGIGRNFTETIDRQSLKFSYDDRAWDESSYDERDHAEGVCRVIQPLPLDFKPVI